MDGPVSKFLQSQDDDMIHAVSGIQTHSLETEEAVDTAAWDYTCMATCISRNALVRFLCCCIAAAEMKYMRRTAGYTWTDYKTNLHIAKEL